VRGGYPHISLAGGLRSRLLLYLSIAGWLTLYTDIYIQSEKVGPSWQTTAPAKLHLGWTAIL
jgi:hypothetical protein